MRTVDLLVVGLGPGGASAAGRASAAGLDVVAVDRRQVLGEPVQCAEFIPTPMSRYARDFPVRQQAITGMTSILPSGRTHRSAFPGLMIDRAEFDRALARQAQAQGAELWHPARLTALDPLRQQATVRRHGREVPLRYRALVAADGPHSTVAARLGLPPLRTLRTRQYSVPLNRPVEETLIWLSDDYPGGYAWLFPRGREANLGLGLDPGIQRDMKTPLDDLHRRLSAEGLTGTAVLRRTGGSIPVGGPRERLREGSTLFVGDAAGLTHPITGAGIAAAVISGEHAGAAVAEWLAGDGDALAGYDEDMRDQFGTALERAVARRQSLQPIWHTPAALRDETQRRGWIAFDEYYEAATA
ncbi:geranylgeranyl reductase family protein [Thioalkalivibrio sp.]|uniref:geranylgeranyl reductase family protein n=1 Tax=Thioalkalivibrio sp. TaxID=2093813 RepID=UPI003566927E